MSEWNEASKQILAEIEKLKGGDRLKLASGIAACNAVLMRSVKGWIHWLQNPLVMDLVNQEDLEKVFAKFKETVLDFLILDIEVTEKYGAQPEPKREHQPVGLVV